MKDGGIAHCAPTQTPQEAQDEWVKTIRATAFDLSQFQRECTPRYFNNEGDEKKARWFLGEGYGPGWDAFQQRMQEWRNKGDLAGLEWH